MSISPDYRLAVIAKQPNPNFLGVGGFLYRAFKRLCNADLFDPGQEPPGYDHYFYVDDGPTAYMEPHYRPASYYAIDMVVKPFWYLDPVEHYFERCQNFDRVFVSSTATRDYCLERGLDVQLLGFAADPDYHRPHDVEREYPWIALWHNCGERVAACDAAYQRFPGGRVLWAGDELYAAWTSRGKCALNWLRGDIVNMRVFEVMAIGTPLITTRHPDMSYFGFIEGEHYLGYEGIPEMLDKIAWANHNPAEAALMASRARAFVLEGHTYYHRALEVINGMG